MISVYANRDRINWSCIDG